MRSVLAGGRKAVGKFSVWLGLGFYVGLMTGCAHQPAPAAVARPMAAGAVTTNPTAAQVLEATTVPAGAATEPAPVVPAPSPASAAEPDGTFLPVGAGLEGPAEGGAGEGPVVNLVEPVASPLQFSLTGTYLYGSVGGHVQIPLGGKGSSTSTNRPKFSEIGISDANVGDGELAVRWDPNQEAFFGAQIIRLGGSDTLHQNLISHGLTFPKGTHVTSDIQLDWYRVGYRYTFPVTRAQNGIPELTLSPYLDMVIWDFSYSLRGHKVGTADRAFTHIGFQLGGTLAWRPGGGPLTLEATLATFPPIDNMATISVESLDARYHFYTWRKVDFSALLGVYFEQQEFRDSQHTANKVSADLGPMLMAGLQVKL